MEVPAAISSVSLRSTPRESAGPNGENEGGDER